MKVMVCISSVECHGLFDQSLDNQKVFADAVHASLARVKQVLLQQNDLLRGLACVEQWVVHVMSTPVAVVGQSSAHQT